MAQIEKEKPELILLDLLLPKISGLKVLKKLRQNPETHNIPVIVISNLTAKGALVRAQKLGVHDYVVKSDTKVQTLIEEINKILP